MNCCSDLSGCNKKEICCDDSNGIKEVVKELYTKIANQTKESNTQSLCGISGGCNIDYSIFSEDYSKLDSYCESADLGLGCGIPTSAVKIKNGDTVLDLGCGAGNDCFIARGMVGKEGRVIGLDMTPEMLKKAWENNDKMGYNNIEFRFGDIENMPVASNMIDIVISNCVINLVPDKNKAFQEIYRVLKPGAIFSISDIVTTDDLPEKMKKAAAMYVGCVSGAEKKTEYLSKCEKLGFKTNVLKEKEIVIPDEIMREYLSEEELIDFKSKNIKILSITLVGQK